MGQSQTLYDILSGICPNVYFQPPETVQMTYPCIVYSLDNMPIEHANNELYLLRKRYTVTVIDRDPNSVIPVQVLSLPYCRHDRSFTNDNLYHNVFTLYYKP